MSDTPLPPSTGASSTWRVRSPALALALLTELHRQLPRLEDGYAEALHEVRVRSLLLGRQIRALHQGVEVFGRAVDLDEEGRLRLERADGATLLLDSAENVRQVF